MWSVSRSNGFMTYSSAPASSAARMCAMSFSVVQNTTLGWSLCPRWRSRRRNSIPLITGMFQSSRTTSGILASQRVRASCPSPASSTSNSRVSRICLATLRITLESSTIKQLFMPGVSRFAVEPVFSRKVVTKTLSCRLGFSAGDEGGDIDEEQRTALGFDHAERGALPPRPHRRAYRRRLRERFDDVFDQVD